MMLKVGFLFLICLLSGCLRTRTDLKEVEANNAMRDQVTTLQKEHADSSSKMDELLEHNRQLSGRIEELEHRLKKNEEQEGSGKTELHSTLEDSKRKNELLQESISKLENQLQALQEEIVSVKTKDRSKNTDKEKAKDKDSDSNKEKSGDRNGDKNKDKSKENSSESHKDNNDDSKSSKDLKPKDKSIYESATELFNEKKWKEAILAFDEYREKFPKGKFLAESTYKSGVCFQELGMKDEAKVFYQEVLTKFPQSDIVKKAQYRLKTLK